MFKLLYDCTHCTCQQGDAQKPPNQASIVPVYQELAAVQAGFRKGRRTRGHIANLCWITEKERIPENKTNKQTKKTKNFCFIDYTKVFECVDHKKLENS